MFLNMEMRNLILRKMFQVLMLLLIFGHYQYGKIQ